MNKSTPHAYTIPSSISVKKGPSFSSGRHVLSILRLGFWRTFWKS